jgi:hypothetical protein
MAANLSRINLLLARTRELDQAVRTNQPADDIMDAVREVERAAAEHDLEAIKRFEPDPDRSQIDPDAEEALAAITFELHAGTVLIALSEAVPDEESGRLGNPEYLQAALQVLEKTQHIAEDSLSIEARARFEADVTGTAAAIDPANAPTEFKDRAEAALEALLKEAEEVIFKAAESLKKIDPVKVLGALSQFSKQSDALAAAGRLLRKGIEKIQEAYNALVRLLGAQLLESVRDKVEEIWKAFKEGKHTHAVLAALYGIDPIKANIQGVLTKPLVDAQALIRACDALAPLAPKFKKHMALLTGLLSAITLAATVLALTPLSVQATPFIAGAYLLVLGAVVVIGREYAGAEWSLQWVKGVGVIVRDLRSAGGAN